MSEIECLVAWLSARFPDARYSLEAPGHPDALWWLDLTANGESYTIQWSAGSGFGLSRSPIEGFANRPEEIYHDLAGIQRLLDRTLGVGSVPEKVISLRGLRSIVGWSQNALADALGKKQGAISRLERRDDVLLSSVRDYLGVLGGELILVAKFPDWSVRLDLSRGINSAAGAEAPVDELRDETERSYDGDVRSYGRISPTEEFARRASSRSDVFPRRPEASEPGAPTTTRGLRGGTARAPTNLRLLKRAV